MPYKFCFYVHHHGAGHLTRCCAVAAQLPAGEVVFAGTGLRTAGMQIPENITCVELPADLPVAGERLHNRPAPGFLHYAPYGVQGLKSRNLELTRIFADNPDLLLIVDVSVEVALLARLCGVPYAYIRQHGLRHDQPHALAYEAAELLIAPYPEEMASETDEGKFAEKTFFSGGFSRYSGATAKVPQPAAGIAVFVGKGGTCFDADFIHRFSAQLPATTIHLIGLPELPGGEVLPANCVSHPHLPDPAALLLGCRAVIANAGHNAVMEILDLGVPFVCVPAERPFGEQEVKARHLHQLRLARVVSSSEFPVADWAACIEEAIGLQQESRSVQIINPDAPVHIARQLENLHQKIFLPADSPRP